MNRVFYNLATALTIVLTLPGISPSPVYALPNPGLVMPISVGMAAKYSQGPHLSGFKMTYITNKGQNYNKH